MILKAAKIENFKCIDNSEEFTLAPVTCLVGKNESGKSTILEALYKLNPVEKDKSNFEALEEYPRKSLSDYEEIKAKSPANVLTTIWELEEKEETAVQEKFGVNLLKNKRIKLTKGYDNRQYWEIEINENVIVEYYLKQLISEPNEIWKGPKLDSITELISQLENIKSPSEKESKVLVEIKKNIPNGQVDNSVITILSSYLPTFLYFSDYQKMMGRVSLDLLLKHKNEKSLAFSEKIFLALLDLAGSSPEDFQKLGKLEHLIAKLEGVSNRISKEIFEYWSQNKNLEIQFRFDSARPNDSPPFNSGYIFWTRIKNTRHGVTVGFDERSTGFVWFFSFLVWFSQVKKNYGENLFILLDEPGLSLHAKAQADLLRYINERLKSNFQVIYSTHSPFMIDPDNILGVRTVEDVSKNGEVLGTKIGDKVLSIDADTVFPLQAALGYEITQTLFVGKHTLLVEGPSDLLYLKWFSQELESLGREHLDPKWIIAPSGGIDKIVSFVTLFRANKLNVAILTDFHKGDKNKVRNLKESELLRKGHVFSAEMYTGEDESDIEDIIGRHTYIALVNQCYGLYNGEALPDGKPYTASKLVVSEVEEHFRSLPTGAPIFDHYRPASFLSENSTKLKKNFPELDGALDRFEKLFKDLNLLL